MRATASKTTNEEVLAVLKMYAPKDNSGISATITPLGNDISGDPSPTRNVSSDTSNSPTIPSINVGRDNSSGPSKGVSSENSGGPSKDVSSDNSGGPTISTSNASSNNSNGLSTVSTKNASGISSICPSNTPTTSTGTIADTSLLPPRGFISEHTESGDTDCDTIAFASVIGSNYSSDAPCEDFCDAFQDSIPTYDCGDEFVHGSSSLTSSLLCEDSSPLGTRNWRSPSAPPFSVRNPLSSYSSSCWPMPPMLRRHTYPPVMSPASDLVSTKILLNGFLYHSYIYILFYIHAHVEWHIF